MNSADQAELRRELAALDGLLSKLMPEDDLARLALDPKRQQAAAQMVGTVTLARDLLARAYKRVVDNNGTAPKERPGKSHDRAVDRWILKHLPTTAVRKSEYVNKMVRAGFNRSNVYFSINRLITDGSLKQTEGKGSGQQRELFV